MAHLETSEQIRERVRGTIIKNREERGRTAPTASSFAAWESFSASHDSRHAARAWNDCASGKPIHFSAKTIDGIVLDFDGTIAVTEHYHRRLFEDTIRYVLKEVSDARGGKPITLEKKDLTKFASAFGKPHDESCQIVAEVLNDKFFKANGIVDSIAIRQTQLVMIHAFMSKVDIAPRPGIVNLIRQAHAAGIKVGIATGSSVHFVAHALTKIRVSPESSETVSDLIPDAHRIYSNDYAKVDGKPSPVPYLMACSRMGVDPTRCLALEDTATGSMAAIRAGLKVALQPAVHYPHALSVTHDKFASAPDIRARCFGIQEKPVFLLARDMGFEQIQLTE